MSFGGGKSNATPEYTKLRLNRSAAYLGIPVVIGWGKISWSLLWFADFTANPTTSSEGGSGGSTITGYTYSASAIFGLCEGPVSEYTYISSLIWKGTDFSTMDEEGFTFFLGDDASTGQQPWSYT